MADAITTTTPATPAAAPVAADPTAAPAAPAVDVAALQAQADKLLKENAALKNESAQRRIETKQERDAKIEAARAAGDLGAALKLIESQRDEALKELESLKPDALAQRCWREGKAKTLDVEAAKLAPHLKDLYDMQPSVEAKAKFIDAMAKAPATTTEPQKKPAAAAAPTGTSAPVTTSATLTAATATVEELEALKKSDPAAFQRLIQMVNPPTTSNPFGL